MGNGLLMNDKSKIKVKFIGKDNPLALRNGKEYEAIVGQKGMYCIIDESGEEYAYNPKLFEIVEE
jgi:hypothetical protein